MLPVPVSYYLDYGQLTEKTRPFMLHEYASCGAEYISLGAPVLGGIMADPSLMFKLRKELKDEGLRFLDSHSVSFHADYDLNCPDPVKRPHMMARHKLGLWIASELEVDTMAFHAGFDFALGKFSMERQIDLVSSSLDELLPEAEKAGVIVCLENIWFAGCMPDVLLELKKRYDTPYCAFCYDSGHAHLVSSAAAKLPDAGARRDWSNSGYDEPLWEDDALEKMLPHVVNCHLHDNDGIIDRHLTPGLGTIQWEKIIPLLRKAPRLKVIHSEVPPVSAKQSVADICRAFHRLGEL